MSGTAMKKLICSTILILGVICIVLLSRGQAVHHSNVVFGRASKHGPDRASQIKVGMTEADVISLMGNPMSQRVYPKFEHKTPAQWAVIQDRADSEASFAAADLNGGVLPQTLKDETDLTHRFHDVWLYQLSGPILMTLYFGEDQTLLNIAFSRAMPRPKPGESISIYDSRERGLIRGG
jgi:hypothetical protein